MGGNSKNLFQLTDNAINSLKKTELVQKIINMKGKVIVDTDIKNLCDQVSKLMETISKLADENMIIKSELRVVKKVNSNLEKRIIDLERAQSKAEQYGRRNNVEISGIPNSIPDEDLETILLKVCNESGIGVTKMDIEGCHRLPLSKHSKEGGDKRVIVKFVNRKNAEALLANKKKINEKDFSHLEIPNKIFISVSLCSYYRFIWGKCKDLQRQGKIDQVFCLGGIVAIKLTETGQPIKVLHVSEVPTSARRNSEE